MKAKKLLQILKDEHLLNEVGEKILEKSNLFLETIEGIEDWMEGEANPLQAIATSSLVGADDELTIQEWVAEEEQDTMRKLLQGIDIRVAKVQVRHPGGNASKGSKTYSMTLPSTWMNEMGVTEEDREVILSFDGDKIIIEKENDEMYLLREDSLAGRLEIEGYVDTKQKYEDGFIMVGTLEEVEAEKKRLEESATPIYAVFRTPLALGGEKVIKKETMYTGNWRGNKYNGYTLLGEYSTMEEAEKNL